MLESFQTDHRQPRYLRLKIQVGRDLEKISKIACALVRPRGSFAFLFFSTIRHALVKDGIEMKYLINFLSANT